MPRGVLAILLLTTLTLVSAWAQADTRAAEIEAARRQKAAQMAPDETTGGEKAFLRIKEGKIIERVTAGVAGFRLGFGGLITGSGFAIGPEYLRRDLRSEERRVGKECRL